MIKVIKQTLNATASPNECERTNIHQTDCCMEHVQITLKYKGWTLSCSYPCTDVTSLSENLTNALIHVSNRCIRTVTLLHVSALKGSSSGSTDTFREQGQQSAIYVYIYKCTEVKTHFHVSYTDYEI
jgi:hypothetical protein